MSAMFIFEYKGKPHVVQTRPKRTVYVRLPDNTYLKLSGNWNYCNVYQTTVTIEEAPFKTIHPACRKKGILKAKEVTPEVKDIYDQ